ncbi:hypothetical protein HZC32_03225 [Candidatus Woesearchaeota archaeon]|nr:hypothetical protein [Candidatus Woesearchaeota archaeon]
MKTMLKLIAVVVLVIFALSVLPMALAEDTTPGEGKEKTKEQKQELTEKLLEKKKELISTLEEKRQNQYEFFKEKIEVAKKRYEFQKQELETANEKSQACKREGKNSTECQEKKLELKRGVKQHLLKTVELIDSSLQRIIERVENSNVLAEEQQKEVLASLQTQEERLTAQKLKVETLVDTATNDELRVAIKELKDTWREVRKVQQRIIVQLINSKLDVLVSKHDEYYSAMEMRIDYLNKKGVDVTGLTALADQFKQQVDQLKADLKAAEDAWAYAKDREDLSEVHDAQQKVREDLEATRETLKEFLQKYRELAKNLKMPAGDRNLSTT